MIPRTIHYCWFGEAQLPDLALKCIESWKKYCPDYQIILWNEKNLDINCNEYVREAYKAKKWSLVADFFRLKIIYDFGGVYLDTDVELIKPLDDLLNNYAYMGIESSGFVNTGSGFGSERNHPLLKELIEEFEQAKFYEEKPAIFSIMKSVMKSHGYIVSNRVQLVYNTTIYPMDYFAPINLTTRKLKITDNTYSIHHYLGSWVSDEHKSWTELRVRFIKHFGEKFGLKFYGHYRELKEVGYRQYLLNRITNAVSKK